MQISRVSNVTCFRALLLLHRGSEPVLSYLTWSRHRRNIISPPFSFFAMSSYSRLAPNCTAVIGAMLVALICGIHIHLSTYLYQVFCVPYVHKCGS